MRVPLLVLSDQWLAQTVLSVSSVTQLCQAPSFWSHTTQLHHDPDPGVRGPWILLTYFCAPYRAFTPHSPSRSRRLRRESATPCGQPVRDAEIRPHGGIDASAPVALRLPTALAPVSQMHAAATPYSAPLRDIDYLIAYSLSRMGISHEFRTQRTSRNAAATIPRCCESGSRTGGLEPTPGRALATCRRRASAAAECTDADARRSPWSLVCARALRHRIAATDGVGNFWTPLGAARADEPGLAFVPCRHRAHLISAPAYSYLALLPTHHFAASLSLAPRRNSAREALPAWKRRPTVWRHVRAAVKNVRVPARERGTDATTASSPDHGALSGRSALL
ncbi:hypothetical protein OBBRIDRAFT_836066 [Obba rivulosa]|uniref:Uncharacterized protein n=1 Tax=Obba rivulosa TaxID=1052685 RepID=A0A8E2ARL1_9APHY|nr:hypothetical protein OBBRIDRAFT_836066 [Obba rivulosa]